MSLLDFSIRHCSLRRSDYDKAPEQLVLDDTFEQQAIELGFEPAQINDEIVTFRLPANKAKLLGEPEARHDLNCCDQELGGYQFASDTCARTTA